MIARAATILRDKSVIDIAPPYDRLKLLADLDALGGAAKMSRDELYERADTIISRTQNIVKLLMEHGHIAAPPKNLA